MNNDIKSSIRTLIRYWEKSAEPWGAKDSQSRFIYANQKYHQLLGLPYGFNIEGRFDGELPASTAHFQEEFQLHDRKVEKLQDRVTSIEIHPFENQDWLQPWFFDKYPLFNERDECCGTIFHGRPVENVVLASLNKIKIPTSLVFTPPSEFFTQREWEVIFYMLHAFTTKEIAGKVGLSQRTIGNYIQNIYSKTGVNSKRGLVEYCYDNNISNYIPQSFFNRSESCLSE